VKIFDCIDKVNVDQIIPADTYNFSSLRKTRILELYKNKLASQLALYLLENDYIEIKEEKIKDGLLVGFELLILNRRKLKKLKEGDEE
jgi:hypothetical protein